MLRVSGYGQTGPYRDLPGFGVIGEAMGGLRHLSGEPGRTPVRVGISIGDSLSALHGVIGILMALRARDQEGGAGQMIDVALYESVFNMMESLLPEYSVFGEVRQAAGSSLPGIAPSNAYRCKGNKFVLIAGNGDSIFKRLMQAIGRDDLAQDPALENNIGRVKQVDRIDDAISQWTIQYELDEVLDTLNENHIPAGKIYDIADIARDPHYQARGMILDSVHQAARRRPEARRHARRRPQRRAQPGPAYRRGAVPPGHRRGHAQGVARTWDCLTQYKWKDAHDGRQGKIVHPGSRAARWLPE
ncbi:MAG: CaiB/BaiF CoA transferase family protein, partial [Pollutimonas bauzanensis]